MNKYSDEENVLTSKEAIESIEQGCDAVEMAECFGITESQLSDLLLHKLDKVKIPRTSMWYEESEEITEIRKAVKAFIELEKSLSAGKGSIMTALHNIFNECVEDYLKKRKE